MDEHTKPDFNVPAIPPEKEEQLTLSQRFADAVTSTLGSWPFIAGQTVVLAAWTTLNLGHYVAWDPNLTFMNVALSCQAAYAASIILMSQKRQVERDRKMAAADYKTDLEVAREVQSLHRKIDFLMAALTPEQRRNAMSTETQALASGTAEANAPRPAVPPSPAAP